jgi:hypothetical protein
MRMNRTGITHTHGKMFGETLDALTLAFVFAVETLRIELIPQAQSFYLTIQSRQIGVRRSWKIEPVLTSSLGSQLRTIWISQYQTTNNRKPTA